jgi:beta-galactosidase
MCLLIRGWSASQCMVWLKIGTRGRRIREDRRWTGVRFGWLPLILGCFTVFSAFGAEPILSGELHSARTPRPHWTRRLQLLKALGLNTVSTYVFWGLHEPESGQFDWSGQNDIAEFCRLAQREGLLVLIRPGPYVCGEYDFGGLPWWLLKDRDMRVRSRHPTYLNAVRRYYQALGEQLAPLQVTRGGPIAMVQVENEYDGHGPDDGYIEALATALRESGFDVPLYTSEMT